MDLLVFIGRVLFTAYFLASAAEHLTRTQTTATEAEPRRAPKARRATLIGGAVLLIGGLSILLGVWADIGALLLAGYLISTAILTNAFWRERDTQARQTGMSGFLKDLALAGAALMLFAFFAYAGSDLGLMISGPLLDIG